MVDSLLTAATFIPIQRNYISNGSDPKKTHYLSFPEHGILITCPLVHKTAEYKILSKWLQPCLDTFNLTTTDSEKKMNQ